MKFYARPQGKHIHTSLECPMLEDGQVVYYKYREVSLDEAKDRHLLICACVNKTFCSHHRLTIAALKRLSRRFS